MTIRRRAAVVGAVVAGLASLAACAEPLPYATVTAGSDSVHAEPVCYDKHGRKLPDSKLRSCLEEKPSQTLKVTPGERLRFGVEPDVADSGWFLAINGQPVMEPIKQTYHSFNGDLFFANQQTGETIDEATVTIVQGAGKDGGGRGVWNFKIERTD